MKIKAIEDKHREIKGFSKKAMADLQNLRSTVGNRRCACQHVLNPRQVEGRSASSICYQRLGPDAAVVPKFGGVAVSEWKPDAAGAMGAASLSAGPSLPRCGGANEKCPRGFGLPKVSVDSD